MTKFFLVFALLLSTLVSNAADSPKIFASCIKMNPDGSETITASITGLSLSSPTSPAYLWIHTGPGTSMSDFMQLSSISASPIYSSGGTYTEGTFTFTIPPSNSFPLNNCITVYVGGYVGAAPWVDPQNTVTYQICPCVTNICYYKDPNTSDLMLRLTTPSSTASQFYAWVDDGTGGTSVDGYYPTPAIGGTILPHGVNFDHLIDLTSPAVGGAVPYKSFTNQCITAYISNSDNNYFGTPSLYGGLNNPADGDNWAYPLPACQCDDIYYGGCINIDRFGTQTVTVHTTATSGPLYLFSAGYGPVTNSGPLVPDGAGGSLATFNLTAFGIGITMECHTFYFSSAMTSPAPANGVTICPCGDSTVPPTVASYANGCMSLDRTGNEIVTVETDNGSSPNYAWFGSMGPIHATGVYPNPSAGPGHLPYIVAFDLSTYGYGISVPYGRCYTFYFSGTTTSPAPSGAMSICPCDGTGSGKSGSTETNSVTNEKIAIIPNPNAGKFTIKGSLYSGRNSKQVTVEILDIIGRVVYTDNASVQDGNLNTQVTLSSTVANGIYTVRIKNQEVNQVVRFTLSR